MLLGLCYAQAKALIESLLENDVFRNILLDVLNKKYA